MSAWARRKEVAVEAARAWAERPAFLEMVEKARVAHAERKVGEIARRAAKAMDALARAPRSRQTAAASRM